jgi:hypothetical protein
MNYPLLMAGDKLPAVGVVQKLLNRSGAGLNADGIFGPKTLAAVKSFQSRARVSPDGVVGGRTWEALTAGLLLPIVDSVDITDPTFYNQDAKYIRQAGGTPVLLGGMCNGVEQAVSMIAGKSQNVFLLRFHGHGLPGIASVTTGETAFDAKEQSDISVDRPVMNTLRRLKTVFGSYGSIEFIECSTGRGPKGQRLLSTISSAVGVPVTAALIDQPFGKTATFRLIGGTYTACPGGVPLQAWCKSLPDFPRR